MEHNLSNIQLYAYACLIFIITGVVCGIVRWNHMCRPFNENGDFHYPARRLVSFFYIAIALEFPYVLSPTTPDYWTYVKIFGIIFYPVCMATLFSSYFFRKRLRDSILLKTYLFSAFALLLSLLAIALTMGGHVLTDAGTPLMAAMGGFSLLFSTLSVHITNQLKRTIDKFNTDNYSNVEDFPLQIRPTGALPAALLDCTDVGCVCLRQPLVQTRRRPHHVGSDDLHAVHNPAPATAVYKQTRARPGKRRQQGHRHDRFAVGNRRHRERSAVDNTPPLPRAASAEIGSAVGNPERQSQRRKQIHNPTGILQPREYVPPAARRPLQGGTSGGKTGGNCRRVGILIAHGVLQGAQKRGGNRRQNREECETLNPLYRHDFRTISRTLATEVAR